MPTKERIAKVERVLAFKQPDLRVVLEDVTNTHNASAVVRTCDSAGILYVDIISTEGQPFPVNEAISTKAEKWLELVPHTSTSDCLNSLKSKGFQIVATHLAKAVKPHSEIDFTRRTAVIFGNESEGISEEACDMADHIVRIPMKGMVQSLNLSVSVGIILYEAMAQRLAKGFYDKRRLSEDEFQHFRSLWLGLGGQTLKNL